MVEVSDFPAFGFDSDFMNGNGTIGADGKYNPFQKPDTSYPFMNPDDRGMYAPWNVITNVQSGALSTFGDPADPDYYWRYIAATEGYVDTGAKDENGNRIYDIFLGGPLNQSYGRMVTGGKYEAIMNVGINVNDNLYFGLNFGATTMNYNYDEYFKEAAKDPSDFVIEYEDASTCFKDYRARYSYSAEGAGVYAKLGFIALPLPGLRIGAAVQTPTWMNISEIWRNSSEVNYTDAGFNGSSVSPEGNFSYMLRTPYRVNAGVAYTALGCFLLNADYEMADYRTMRSGNDDAPEAIGCVEGQQRLFQQGKHAVEQNLPDIAQHHAADQVGHEKDGAEHVGAPHVAGEQHGQQEGQHIDEHGGHDGEHRGKAEGVPLLPVGKAQGAAQRAHRPQLAQAP